MNQILQSSISPAIIDLGVGNPAQELLPLGLLRQAAEHALAQGDAAPLQYGYEAGDIRFREALAAFLATQYRRPVDPGQLLAAR